MLTREAYERLCDTRVRTPHALREALLTRSRRAFAGDDGRLLVIAADHTSRGIISVGHNTLALANRFELLDRLMRALAVPGVDGVLGSADVLEELAWLGALDGRLAIGTMNRWGIRGASWELDDRFTAYDADHLAGLDAAKLLVRIEDTDHGVARTLEHAARAVTAVADQRLPCLVEPLPYVKDEAGRPVLDARGDMLVRAVSIASGLGSISAYTWLKVPPVRDFAPVAAATTMPILLLGGDPGDAWPSLVDAWSEALAEPGVRGLIPGRALLYPQDDDVERMVAVASDLVHPKENA